MTNIYMTVRGTHAQATAHGCLTSGMVGVAVKFEYSDIWDELHKTAVFSAGGVTRDVADISDSCTVPAEALAKAGTILYVGVYGWRDDGTIVIPTIMAPVGMIAPGADPSGDPGTDPSLPIWAQIQQMVEKLKLDPEAVRQIVADYLADDAGVVTKATADLENYYLKSETYSRNEIDRLISQIPKFGLQVVAALPTAGISDTTIYLVPGGADGNMYTEYIHVDDEWEILGSQRIDLTGYATEEWVSDLIDGKLDADRLPKAINTALAQAKESGKFDGKDGEPGVSGVYVGPGDMPEGYNIQIDPDGDADGAIKKMIYDALAEVPAGLTAAQINALDGMFKVCAFAVDPTEAYAEFRAAFGLSGSGSDTPDIPDIPDEPDEPEVKVYTVTNNLTHVSNSNSATTASGYYSATLTVHDGCVLNNLSITMGGVDLTDSVYSEGSILITDVTGNIVITATAAQLQKITSTSAYADTVRMYSDNGATMVTTKNYLNGAVTLNATETETTVKVKLTNTTAEGIGCRVYMASAPDWIGELHYVSQEMVTNIPVNGSIEYEYTVKAGYKFAIAGTPASGVQIDMYGAFDVYQPVAEFATKLSYADSIKIYSDGTTGNLLKTSNYQNVIHTTEVFDEETDLIVTLVGGDADVMFAASDWYFGAVNPSAHHSIYYGIQKNTGNTTTLKANQIIKYTHTVQAGYAFAMGAVANNTLTAAMVYVERA